MKTNEWIEHLNQSIGVGFGYLMLDQEWSSILTAALMWFLIGIPVRFLLNKIFNAIGWRV